MSIYILFMLMMLSFYILSLDKRLSSYRKILYLICTSLIILFSSVRYNVGIDYKAYYMLYNEFTVGVKSAIEPGIYILMSWSENYYQFIFYATILPLILIFYCLYQTSSYKILSLILFLITADNYLATLSFFRQAIAISLFFFSVVCILKNKKILAGVAITFGGVFHYSILIAIPFLLIIKINKIKKWYLMMPFVFYLLSFFGYLNYFSIFVIDHIGIYSDYIKTNAFSGTSGVGIGFLINYIVFLILYSLQDKRKYLFSYKKDRILILFYLVSLAFQGAAVNFLMMYRIQMIFSPFICLVMPILINNLKVKVKKDKVIILLLLVYLILFFRNFNSQSFLNGFIPYQTIFFVN